MFRFPLVKSNPTEGGRFFALCGGETLGVLEETPELTVQRTSQDVIPKSKTVNISAQTFLAFSTFRSTD